MTKTINYLFNIILCFCPFILFAQQNKIDSLTFRLSQSLHDTDRVNTLNALGWQLMYSNPDTAIILGNQALSITEGLLPLKQGGGRQGVRRLLANTLGNLATYNYFKSDYPKALDYYLKALKFVPSESEGTPDDKKKVASILGNIGNVHLNQGDYHKALDYYFRALKMDEELGDKNGIASDLGNIGIVYDEQGDYSKALGYYFRALKTFEELGDKNRIATALGNIGIIYWNQGDYPKALDYYFGALKMAKELGNKNVIARHLGNIGIVYYDQADYTKALDYYFKALKMAEELGNKNYIAAWLGNIGNVYADQGDSASAKGNKTFAMADRYPKALDYYFRALKIGEELRDKNGIAIRLGNIGSLYTKTGKFAEAEKYLKQAIAIDSTIRSQKYLMEAEEDISHLYYTTAQLATGSGQYAKAAEKYKLSLLHYKKAMLLKDSIFTMEKDKEITRKEMTYEFEKKEAATKAEQDKKDAVTVEEKRKQRVIIYSISAGLFLVLLLAFFIFRGYKQKQKANVIITQQKNEVEKQKHIIEEKNKDITDSINYAKRIQQAKLPNKEEIYSSLPNSFLLFKPKDIVSGDFYFYSPLENGKGCIIAAADCTGHGVPGAFMSMIGSEKLDDAVKHSSNPGEILSFVNKGIKTSLQQDESKESTKDGMDIAFCYVDIENRIVKYAGANRPIWIIRNGKAEIEEIKATKKAIGGFTEDNQVFETHTIQLQQGDTFYIFSDGYADQDGGDKGKRLMTKPFKQMLIDIQDKSMKEQKNYLEEFMDKWRGDKEQLDDILIIGIKIS